jgi:hypothetical protein
VPEPGAGGGFHGPGMGRGRAGGGKQNAGRQPTFT